MPRALIQTNFRESTLEPAETKRAPRAMGSVSENPYEITRQGSEVNIPRRPGEAWNVRLDLASGVLNAPLTPNPESHYMLREGLGDPNGIGDIYVSGSELTTSPIFQLERMMTVPLTQLDLLGVGIIGAKNKELEEYTAIARAKLAAFFATYSEAVEGSRLGKPKIENLFLSAQRTGNPGPERLQQIIGGQLLRTLQDAYKKR